MKIFTEFYSNYKRKAYFKMDEQLEFIEMFDSHMQSGRLSMKQAIAKVGETYVAVYGETHIVNEICNLIIKALNTGEPYDNIMKKYFHPNIAIGYELAQSVSVNKDAVKGISELVKIEREIFRDAWSKVAMPLMLLVVGLMSLAVVGRFVLPMLEKTIKVPVESFERSLSLFMAYVIFDLWFVLLAIAILGVIFYKKIQERWTGDNREIADRIWPFSNYRIFWSVRLLQLLGLLKKSGLRDIKALSMIKKYGSPYINVHIDKMIADSKTGVSKKGRFGHGLLTSLQHIRLESYLDISDEVFSDGLLDVAKKATIDIKSQNKRIVGRWSLFMLLIAFVLMGSAVGVVVDSGTSMALQQ